MTSLKLVVELALNSGSLAPDCLFFFFFDPNGAEVFLRFASDIMEFKTAGGK